MLIDGHLRAETTPDAVVPVLILDVDETEADKILLTHDPIAAMATISEEHLQAAPCRSANRKRRRPINARLINAVSPRLPGFSLPPEDSPSPKATRSSSNVATKPIRKSVVTRMRAKVPLSNIDAVRRIPNDECKCRLFIRISHSSFVMRNHHADVLTL